MDRLIADEEQVFLRRQPRSTELIAEAGEHLAGGVDVQLADRRSRRPSG